MERIIDVVITANRPSEERLKEQHAAIVHGFYEAAEVVAEGFLTESLKELGVQAIFQSAAARRIRIDEIYYRLLTKKPVLASESLEGAYALTGVQLVFPF